MKPILKGSTDEPVNLESWQDLDEMYTLPPGKAYATLLGYAHSTEVELNPSRLYEDTE